MSVIKVKKRALLFSNIFTDGWGVLFPHRKLKHDSFGNSIATAFESKNKKFTLRISNKGP